MGSRQEYGFEVLNNDDLVEVWVKLVPPKMYVEVHSRTPGRKGVRKIECGFLDMLDSDYKINPPNQ